MTILTADTRDFLGIDRIDRNDLQTILAFGHELKKKPLAFRPMEGKTLALIFEKPSTRTRVSFEVGMRQLGGEVTTLSGAEIQLGRGETVADTGRVLSRYTDIIMLRTFAEHKLFELAQGATVPVINGLTDRSHPCQLMADMMTAEEHFGSMKGKLVVWCGDGDNNVLTSWMHAAPIFDFSLRILAPPEFAPPTSLLAACQKQGARIEVSAEPDAVEGADLVITDCWVSMHNSDVAAREERLAAFSVTSSLMRKANKDAIFLHCLPAHRGEEVSDDVLDGPQSKAWDAAENRMHAQKAILCWCLGVEPPK